MVVVAGGQRGGGGEHAARPFTGKRLMVRLASVQSDALE
jgi:hypothetical protein